MHLWFEAFLTDVDKPIIQTNWVVGFFLQRLEAEAKEEVEAAVEVAKASPDPILDDLFLDVYADDNMEGHKIRGCDNWIRQATN